MRNKNGCVDEENEEFYMNLGNNFYLQLQTNLFLYFKLPHDNFFSGELSIVFSPLLCLNLVLNYNNVFYPTRENSITVSLLAVVLLLLLGLCTFQLFIAVSLTVSSDN